MRSKLNILRLLLLGLAISNISCANLKYEIVDLGILTSNSSYAKAVNEKGQVIGKLCNPFGNTYICKAFFWDKTIGMIDLGTLGGRESRADSINETGKVVGDSKTTNDKWRGFLWDSSNGMKDIGTLGGNESYVASINQAGKIVGIFKTANDDWHAYLWDSTSGMIDLGIPGNKFCSPLGINDSDQVAGWRQDATGKMYLFFWDSYNGMKDLVELGDTSVMEYMSINNKGRVVAAWFRTDSRKYNSILWDSDIGIVHLEALGTRGSCVSAINDNGQVVGWSNENPPFGGRRACLWDSSGKVTNLGAIGDAWSLMVGIESKALGINDAGQVVGWAGRDDTMLVPGHAFLWGKMRGMRKLKNLLVDKSGWKQLIEATDINNRG